MYLPGHRRQNAPEATQSWAEIYGNNPGDVDSTNGANGTPPPAMARLQEMLDLDSLPEDISTLDLFPFIDGVFTQSEIDLAFSSNLDPGSGQAWLDNWWQDENVMYE
jgi:hypothetical protein